MLSVLRLFQVGHVVQNKRTVLKSLLGTNGFHVKTKDETSTSRARVVVRTSKMKISHCCLRWKTITSRLRLRLRQKIALKSVPHAQHDYFSSFNQSYHWFVALSLPLLSSFLKLPCVRGRHHNRLLSRCSLYRLERNWPKHGKACNKWRRNWWDKRRVLERNASILTLKCYLCRKPTPNLR